MKLLLLALAGAAALSASEHRPQNAGLPIVHTQAAQQPRMLFAPCPLAPRFLPLPSERRA